MTSSAGRDEEQVISKTGENERRRLGTEAIEQLASGLNLAANTIEGFSQTVSLYFRRKNSLACQSLVGRYCSNSIHATLLSFHRILTFHRCLFGIHESCVLL